MMPFLKRPIIISAMRQNTLSGVRSLAAALVVAAVALPYVRPIVCEIGAPETMGMTHEAGADQAAWVSGDTPTCHGMAGCPVAPVGPALGPDAGFALSPAISQKGWTPVDWAVLRPLSPLTPPPRV